jgi:phenylalanyl-tRNA synthetase beta chain
MNISYEWLRALLPDAALASPAELRDLITSRVVTVDDVVPLRDDLAPIVVARVVESVKIPETKLSANKVDAGTGELLDVVCGAPNVTAGALYPFAPTGTTMPNGLKIEKRKIRGAVSNGMLCSARELGLGEDHEGIMQLDIDAVPGTPFLGVMPVGDTRIVVDVTPNRPDLLSHYGIAREVAAATHATLVLPTIDGAPSVPAPVEVGHGTTGGVTVRIDDAQLARRYMGVVVRGIRVGPSPEWVVRRLEAVGSRSINNVVDATNIVLHELGQPTHAFDAARLRGSTIIVRRARTGERLVTLDGVERVLSETMAVIADAEGAQALAGVMGGRDSEVTEQTTDLFIEVANFDPSGTRAMRRALGMSTDASYRFERGVDEELAATALERVVQLIVALAGGQIDGAPVDLRPSRRKRKSMELRVGRVEQLLGEPVPADEITSLLRSVGFDVRERSGTMDVTPPSWRGDVVREVDLIEEVARLRGYDSFPDELRPQRPGNVPDSPDWIIARHVRDALVGAGLLEARPMPFVAGEDATHLRVANPLAENEAHLRRDVLETLARRAEHNLAHRQGNIRLFEIGSAFQPDAPLPREELRVAALVMGDRQPKHFTDPEPRPFDEWDIRWLAELASRAAWPGAEVALRESEAEGALWDIVVAGESRGVARPVTLDSPVWAKRAFGFELVLFRTSAAATAAPAQNAWSTQATVRPRVQPTAPYRPLPATPAAEFDLALLVPPGVRAADVERVIRKTGGEVLESLELFDLFEGPGIEPGFRSLAWHLIFRHPERTLTSKETDARRERIVTALDKELNVRPRSA